MTSPLKINLFILLITTIFSTSALSDEKWCHFKTQKTFEGLITISYGLKNAGKCDCAEGFTYDFDENLMLFYKSPGDFLDSLEGESLYIKGLAQKFFPSKDAKKHLALYVEKFKIAGEVLDKNNKVFGLNIHVYLTPKYAKQHGLDKDRPIEFVFSKSESTCNSLLNETLTHYKEVNEKKKYKKNEKYK